MDSQIKNRPFPQTIEGITGLESPIVSANIQNFAMEVNGDYPPHFIFQVDGDFPNGETIFVQYSPGIVNVAGNYDITSIEKDGICLMCKDYEFGVGPMDVSKRSDINRLKRIMRDESIELYLNPAGRFPVVYDLEASEPHKVSDKDNVNIRLMHKALDGLCSNGITPVIRFTAPVNHEENC